MSLARRCLRMLCEDRWSGDAGFLPPSESDDFTMRAYSDDPETYRRIMAAVYKRFMRRGGWRLDYEHGQWWVTDHRSGAQYAVEAAEGPGTVDGFDFELVTPGEEF